MTKLLGYAGRLLLVICLIPLFVFMAVVLGIEEILGV